MTTATQKSETVLKWEKQWYKFRAIQEDEILIKKELHFFSQQDQLQLLNFANLNLSKVFKKFDEMREIFEHLIESQHLLHFLFDDEFPHQFHSLEFSIQIDEHIEIKLEPTDSTDEELMVECTISNGTNSLNFRINEQSADELEIEMTSK